MKLTILSHYPADRELAIGEASKIKMCDGKYTLMMPCPKCGTGKYRVDIIPLS